MRACSAAWGLAAKGCCCDLPCALQPASICTANTLAFNTMPPLPLAGVHGLMNAYLRTGPQVLSPEPAAIGGVIRAPGAAAVPASGLLAVTGPGGVGVYGMVKGAAAYLRTGAQQLSPEPGMEGQQAASPSQLPAALPHPYSPASPLAATPVAPTGATLAGASGSGIALSRRPTSVCSNGEVGSCGPAGSISLGGAPSPAPSSAGPPSVPRLNLAALRQQQEGGTDGTEVSFGAVVAPAALQGQQEQPGSPASDELPTARFSPATSPAAGERQDEAPAVPSGGPAPSAITFCLPAEAPSQEHAAAAAPGKLGEVKGKVSSWPGLVEAAAVPRPHCLLGTSFPVPARLLQPQTRPHSPLALAPHLLLGKRPSLQQARWLPARRPQTVPQQCRQPCHATIRAKPSSSPTRSRRCCTTCAAPSMPPQPALCCVAGQGCSWSRRRARSRPRSSHPCTSSPSQRAAPPPLHVSAWAEGS